ncbi:anti-sigma factor [Klenkia sp. LSe6-5]|uniref:Anti-sigma factor n=1 Tax=Klenkia sesuvii TaxID=3103137 RepID=A0ABU8DY06_9ACTN
MTHCAPEDLAVAALGEQLPAADARHLTTCPTCTAEVRSLRRAVEAVAPADVPEDGPPIPVSDRVWAAVAAQTGVTATPRSAGPALVGLPSPVDASTPAPADDTTAAAPALRAVPASPAGAEEAGTSVGPARRSTRRRWVVTSAVAAGLLVGVAVGAALTRDAGTPVPIPGTAVASAQLDPFGDWDSSGEATLTETDGRWDLQVQLTAPPPATDGFYEVWLLSADRGALSLGNLEGASGSYVVPEGVDLADYDTVDVSLEPYDGDPEHSSDSVARGTLR